MPEPVRVAPEQVAAITAAVVTLSSLLRWAAPRHLNHDREALVVGGLALLAVLAWFVSSGDDWGTNDVWPLVVLWVTVTAAGAGVFGFVRERRDGRR